MSTSISTTTRMFPMLSCRNIKSILRKARKQCNTNASGNCTHRFGRVRDSHGLATFESFSAWQSSGIAKKIRDLKKEYHYKVREAFHNIRSFYSFANMLHQKQSGADGSRYNARLFIRDTHHIGKCRERKRSLSAQSRSISFPGLLQTVPEWGGLRTLLRGKGQESGGKGRWCN